MSNIKDDGLDQYGRFTYSTLWSVTI